MKNHNEKGKARRDFLEFSVGFVSHVETMLTRFTRQFTFLIRACIVCMKEAGNMGRRRIAAVSREVVHISLLRRWSLKLRMNARSLLKECRNLIFSLSTHSPNTSSSSSSQQETNSVYLRILIHHVLFSIRRRPPSRPPQF